jgi:hypothetical protein
MCNVKVDGVVYSGLAGQGNDETWAAALPSPKMLVGHVTLNLHSFL